MTRTYAAKRLLEHGPLTFRELHQITGWARGKVEGALAALIESGVVVAEKIGPHRNSYRLAE